VSKPITKIKLLRPHLTTYGGFQWEVGKWVETDGNGLLCSKHWLHFYHTTDLAVLLQPLHTKYNPFVLYEAEVRGKMKDDNGLKVCYTEARLIKPIETPVWTTPQRIAFGIYCALAVYREESFVEWAENWLSGKDRSARSAAWSAAHVARSTGWSAARSAAWSAARSAAWSAAGVAPPSPWSAAATGAAEGSVKATKDPLALLLDAVEKAKGLQK